MIYGTGLNFTFPKLIETNEARYYWQQALADATVCSQFVSPQSLGSRFDIPKNESTEHLRINNMKLVSKQYLPECTAIGLDMCWWGIADRIDWPAWYPLDNPVHFAVSNVAGYRSAALYRILFLEHTVWASTVHKVCSYFGSINEKMAIDILTPTVLLLSQCPNAERFVAISD